MRELWDLKMLWRLVRSVRVELWSLIRDVGGFALACTRSIWARKALRDFLSFLPVLAKRVDSSMSAFLGLRKGVLAIAKCVNDSYDIVAIAFSRSTFAAAVTGCKRWVLIDMMLL